MLGMTWIAGLVRRRLGRLVAVAVGIALAVGLLASIGSFVSHSKATMTKRSAATVAVDWQVEVQPGGDPNAVAQTIAQQPGVRSVLPVGFAETSGLSATAGGTTQTTGSGVVLGIPAGYRAAFPDAIRDLVGGQTGVLVAQQTAANLHVAPGDTVAIGRAGLKPATVRVSGVVDLPQAQSLFQTVGAPANAQPTASPDNVVLLPIEQWHRIFDPLKATRADLVRMQFHVRLDHRLPADPSTAYASVLGRANNLEVKLAGTGLVGDNLAATLGAARGDALYAEVLFLFLGLPGAVLAGLLTATVANAGADRRRREQALLRTRGATTRQLVQIAVSETAFVGALGSSAGLGLAAAVGTVEFHHAGFGATHRQRDRLGRRRGTRRFRHRRGVDRLACRPRRPRDHCFECAGTSDGQRRRAGFASVSTVGCSPRASCSGSPAAVDTSSCSPPKASLRSRSATGPSPVPRCSGSVRACSPGVSAISSSAEGEGRSPSPCVPSRDRWRAPSPRR